MPTALSLAPLSLAAVLLLSGVAKLRDPGATTSMVRMLRLPALLRGRTVGYALPLAELATAGWLLTPWRWTYALGAGAAAALLVAFLMVIARAMTFTPRPTCACFGRVGDHRITWRTVLRNGLLVSLAAVAVGIAASGETTWSLIAAYQRHDWVWLALTFAVAAAAVLVLARPAEDPDMAGAPPGERPRHRPVPAGIVVDERLRTSSLAALTRSGPQLLILVNCWCGSTIEAITRLPGWRERLPQVGVPLVHTMTPWGEQRLAHLPQVFWDPGSQLYATLEAGASPVGVLLDQGGRVLHGPASGLEAIDALVESIQAQIPRAPAAS